VVVAIAGLNRFEVPVSPVFLLEQSTEMALPELQESGTGSVILSGNLELFSEVCHLLSPGFLPRTPSEG
jgi:hypothetical protein